MMIFETADPRGFLFVEERRCSTEARTLPGSARPRREAISEEHKPSVGSCTHFKSRANWLHPLPAERAVRTQASFWMEPPDRTLAPGARGRCSCQGHLAETLGQLLPRGGLFLQAAQDQPSGVQAGTAWLRVIMSWYRRTLQSEEKETHLQHLNTQGFSEQREDFIPEARDRKEEDSAGGELRSQQEAG
ncbi:hypothetical protein P7K49_009947, partial [Saguinus oedipus]